MGTEANSEHNAIPLKQQRIQIVLDCRADTGLKSERMPFREALLPLHKVHAMKHLPRNAVSNTLRLHPGDTCWGSRGALCGKGCALECGGGQCHVASVNRLSPDGTPTPDLLSTLQRIGPELCARQSIKSGLISNNLDGPISPKVVSNTTDGSCPSSQKKSLRAPLKQL